VARRAAPAFRLTGRTMRNPHAHPPHDPRRNARGGSTVLRIDTGNTAFMLLCSSLVMLMTPGLAFFYGGLVGRKNVLAIMIQSFVSLCWTTVVWFVCGYSLCFSGDVGGVIGNLDMAFMRGVNLMAPSPNDSIPLIVHIAYQMMFAIITPALITGAFANRVRFKAYFIFLTMWLLFVYFPFVHMVWGGGVLAKWGVLDFAGGIVVHNIAGIAALASVLYVGRRRVQDNGPHSIPLVALGTGLLWFGWYGFNAGSEFRVDAVTATAFLNTDLAASFAGMAWFLIEWVSGTKPKFLGLLTGSVAGLATITPAAGYVSPASAAIIGIVSGVVCFYAVALKNRLHWDDALDVWGVHGVGGFIGIILLGVFATRAYNPAGTDGLLAGNLGFFVKQCVAVLLSSVWAFVFTYGMLWLIDRVTPVKVAAGAEEAGLDQTLHGETAYVEAL
jgi:Amt family ammonium transporter